MAAGDFGTDAPEPEVAPAGALVGEEPPEPEDFEDSEEPEPELSRDALFEGASAVALPLAVPVPLALAVPVAGLAGPAGAVAESPSEAAREDERLSVL